jgi:hypothetical protein
VGCATEASPVANAAVGESDFVTDSAAQGLEIARPLPELQAGSDQGGERPEVRAGGADRDAAASPALSALAVDERAFVTGLAAQALEIMQSLPELRPASGEPRERPEAGVGAADPHADPRVLPGPSGAGGRNAAEPGDRDVTPEPAARLYDRWVGHEEWARGRNPWRSRSTISTDRIHA